MKKFVSLFFTLVLCCALISAVAEGNGVTEDIIAKLPEPGWVLDSVNGAGQRERRGMAG